MSTRAAIRQEVGRTLGLCTTGTCSAISALGANYIIDSTATLLGAYDPQRWPRGSPIRLTYADTTTVDMTLDRYEPNTGKLYISPVLVTATAVTTTYEIWPGGLVDTVNDIDRAINSALTEHCYRWRLTPLTVAKDGGMELSTFADWTAATATVAKATLTDLAFFSRGLTVVTTTGATWQYAASASMPVTPGDSWNINAMAYSAVGTTPAEVRVYDVTNAATVTLSGDGGFSYDTSWAVLANTFTVPSGCHLIQLRLGATGVGVAVTVGFTQVCLWKSDQTSFLLPSRIVSENDVGNILIRSGEDPQEFSFGPYEQYGASSGVYTAATGTIVDLSSSPGVDSPAYIEELTTYESVAISAAASIDATDIGAASELLEAAFEYELLKRIANRAYSRDTLAGYPAASEWKQKRDEAKKTLRAAQVSLGPKGRVVRH